MSGISRDLLSELLLNFMQPIARLCLGAGVCAQDVKKAVDRAFVAAAVEQIQDSGEKVSTARISVLTGLQRRLIKSIRTGPEESKKPRSLLMKVIYQWTQDPEFSQQPSSSPNPLSQEEFELLVRSLSQDIKPATILTQMKSMNLVQQELGQIKLLTDGYNAKGVPEEAFRFLASDVNDLIETVHSNINGNPELLHATTEYSDLPSCHRETIRIWVLQEGMKFHRKLRAFAEVLVNDVEPDEPTTRFAVGTFMNIEKGDEQ